MPVPMEDSRPVVTASVPTSVPSRTHLFERRMGVCCGSIGCWILFSVVQALVELRAASVCIFPDVIRGLCFLLVDVNSA